MQDCLCLFLHPRCTSHAFSGCCCALLLMCIEVTKAAVAPVASTHRAVLHYCVQKHNSMVHLSGDAVFPMLIAAAPGVLKQEAMVSDHISINSLRVYHIVIIRRPASMQDHCHASSASGICIGKLVQHLWVLISAVCWWLRSANTDLGRGSEES